MSRTISINMSLTPIVEHDVSADRYIVYYKEFPQAIASGLSEDEAENNLIFIVEEMWKRQENDLKKFLLDNYIKDIHIKSQSRANP